MTEFEGTEVSLDEFNEHVEAAGAEILYTADGVHYYGFNYCGKTVLFGTHNPETGACRIDFPF